jgi:hypothetical protein
MPRKTRNLLTAGMKASVGRGYEEIEKLSPDLSCRQIHKILMHIFSVIVVNLYF